MIDRPALVAWRSKVPWPNPVQIEQDLLLSRLMIEIARDEVLGPELVMRGGTCLNKLHLVGRRSSSHKTLCQWAIPRASSTRPLRTMIRPTHHVHDVSPIRRR